MKIAQHSLRVSAALAVVSGLVLLSQSARKSIADPAVSANTVIATGITRPSQELKLAFAAPGIVSDVPVKEGDLVNIKQVLASQDSRQEVWALKSLQSKADSMDKINYSIADRDSKLVEDKRKNDLFLKHAASQAEVDEADLAVKLAEAQINLAKQEHDTDGYDAQKEAVKIEQMQIVSPVKGIVEKINVGPGEMADPQSRDGAIVVGVWDPLWLEVHLPSAQAAQLKMGDPLAVRYDGGEWQTAKIIYFEKVDAASDTEMVRMELPNPGNQKPAGLHMQVKLPDSVTAVAASNGQ
jgi:multidrug efflux pump subunit AcrA (membrane-fusion protein)